MTYTVDAVFKAMGLRMQQTIVRRTYYTRPGVTLLARELLSFNYLKNRRANVGRRTNCLVSLQLLSEMFLLRKFGGSHCEFAQATSILGRCLVSSGKVTDAEREDEHTWIVRTVFDCFILNIKTPRPFETSVTTHQRTQSNISGHAFLHSLLPKISGQVHLRLA